MNSNFCLQLLPPITQAIFPIGKPVEIRSFVDTNCGWEFDAPLHFFHPFHLYYEVGSSGDDTVNGMIEDLLVDLEEREVKQSLSTWPYMNNHYEEMVSKIRTNKAPKRLTLYQTTVVVRHWGENGYEVKTVEVDKTGKPV